MKKIAIAIAATACLASTGAMAQVYVTGGAGVSRVNIDCAGAATCDRSGTAARLGVGYGFGNGFAAELGYINFGKAKVADAGDSLSIKADAFTLAGAFRASLDDSWGLNVRLGIAQVKTKASATLAGVGSGTASDTATKPYFGLGVDYALTKNLKVDLSADFTQGEIVGEKASVRAVTVGVRYDF